MPRGLYSFHDPHGGALLGYERFACAPGPGGWRYVADVLAVDGRTSVGAVDLTVDDAGRPVRLDLSRGRWRVRGGQAGPQVRWVRLASDPTQESEVGAEWAEVAAGFFGRSPAFTIAAARLLAAADAERFAVTAVDPGPAPNDPRRLRHVVLTDPVLAARTTVTGWSLVDVTSHATPTGPLVVRAFAITDLETGERATAHLAGDVMLAGPGVELEELTDPPNQ